MTVLELTTAPGDMGKIIGRQGRTVAALRMLVSLTAEKHGVRAQLDIRDLRWPNWNIGIFIGSFLSKLVNVQIGQSTIS
jgi:hypothetical protein